MGRYLGLVFAAFLLFFIGHCLLFFAQFGVPTETSRWIHENIEKKRAIAKRIDKPKILVVGGSSALYSISAQKMSKELEVPVVNCGTHAGLKLDYILHSFKDVIGPGDTVLLTLEYNTYNFGGESSIVSADYIASRDPTFALSSLRVFLNIAFSYDVPKLLRRNWKRFFPDRIRRGFMETEFINAHGDKTNQAAENQTMKQRRLVESAEPVILEVDPDLHSFKLLKRFIRYCRSKNAEVVATFPPIKRDEAYGAKSFAVGVVKIREFYDSMEVPIIGPPETFMLEEDYFFDTIYHTNLQGREIITNKLIDALRPFVSPWRSR